jgi:putative aldouronate transport system substrate-binding protein
MRLFGKLLVIAVLLGMFSSPVFATGSSADPDLGAEERFTVSLHVRVDADPEGWIFKYWSEKLSIDFVPILIETSSWIEMLSLKIASGDEPDTWYLNGNYELLGRHIEDEVIAEIPREMLQTHGPGIIKALDSIKNGEGWAAATAGGKGKIYNLPYVVGYWKYLNPVIWRLDWLEKAGFSEPPTALAQVEKAFYAFRNDDPDGNGKQDTYALSKSGLTPIYGAFGYIPNYWSIKNKKLVYGAVQPEMKEALTLLAKWYKEGIIDPEFITGENVGGYWALTHAFINSKIGFTKRGSFYHWKPATYEGDTPGQNNSEFYALNPDGKFAFGKPPVGPNGKAGLTKVPACGPHRVFSTRLEDEPERYARIIKLFNDTNMTEEAYIAQSLGKEGLHHERIHGVPTRIGIYKDWKELEKVGGISTFMSTCPIEAMWWRSPHWKDFCEDNLIEEPFYNQELKTPLPSDKKYKAELRKFEDEMYIKFITGAEPMDQFDKFVDEWFSSGGSQLTEEANEWFANK